MLIIISKVPHKPMQYSSKNVPNVVIADLNLPDINWDSQQTTNSRTASK